jgi:hypothetical protein
LGTEKIRINEDLTHMPSPVTSLRLCRELELIDQATSCSRDSATRSLLVVSLKRAQRRAWSKETEPTEQRRVEVRRGRGTAYLARATGQVETG